MRGNGNRYPNSDENENKYKNNETENGNQIAWVESDEMEILMLTSSTAFTSAQPSTYCVIVMQ